MKSYSCSSKAILLLENYYVRQLERYFHSWRDIPATGELFLPLRAIPEARAISFVIEMQLLADSALFLVAGEILYSYPWRTIPAVASTKKKMDCVLQQQQKFLAVTSRRATRTAPLGKALQRQSYLSRRKRLHSFPRRYQEADLRRWIAMPVAGELFFYPEIYYFSYRAIPLSG